MRMVKARRREDTVVPWLWWLYIVFRFKMTIIVLFFSLLMCNNLVNNSDSCTYVEIRKGSRWFSCTHEFLLDNNFSAVRHANKSSNSNHMFWKYKVDTFIKLLSILSWLKYFLAVIKKQMIQVNFLISFITHFQKELKEGNFK